MAGATAVGAVGDADAMEDDAKETAPPAHAAVREAAQEPEDRLQIRVWEATGESSEEGAVARLEAAVVDLMATTHIRALLHDYLWQLQPLAFSVVDPASGDMPPGGDTVHRTVDGRRPYIYASLAFGDAMADEWLAVYLLFELTRRSSTLIGEAIDSDGQPLLIEAALELPRWLKPDRSENRVFVRDGRVHIVPLSIAARDETPTLEEALRNVAAGDGSATVASPGVQSVLEKRLNSVVESSRKENSHVARCLLPPHAARVLQRQPSLVAAAATAFHYREPDDVSVAARMSVFGAQARALRAAGGSSSPREPALVPMSVRFTRCLFAMVDRQQFGTPKVFEGLVPDDESHPDYSAGARGVKLAAGLEMLAHRAAAKAVLDGDETAVDGRAVRGPRKWASLQAALRARGFFEGVAATTATDALYVSRNLTARRASRWLRAPHETDVRDRCAVRLARAMLAARKNEPPVPTWPPPVSERDDDDSWLSLSYEELERELARMDEAGGGAASAQALVGEMSSFVDKLSGPDGVTQGRAQRETAPRSPRRDDPPGDDSDSTESGSEDDGQDDLPGEEDPASVSLDVDRLMSILRGSTDDSAPASPAGDEVADAGADEDDSDVMMSSGDEATGSPSMDDFMGHMDRELASTTLRKSFEVVGGGATKEAAPAGEGKMRDADEGSRDGTASAAREESDDDADPDDLPPVDIDFNLVKNLISSAGAQGGLSGPTTNVLGDLGVRLPAHLVAAAAGDAADAGQDGAGGDD